MHQMQDSNLEEADSFFTRPTLDLYFCNKYWNFITKDMEREQLQDMENAKKELERYEKVYSIMEYTSHMSGLVTCLETRIATNNPSVV